VVVIVIVIEIVVQSEEEEIQLLPGLASTMREVLSGLVVQRA